ARNNANAAMAEGYAQRRLERERRAEADLGEAVPEEVDRCEGLRARGEVPSAVEQVAGDDVLRIFTELMLREHAGHRVDAVGREGEEKNGSDDLEQTVDTLADDTDIEEDMDYPVSRRYIHLRCS